MNQARKFNFKTHVEKLNPTSRTDLSNKTLRSILYWKLLFKPFPYKSFGWCNAHSVQADALWGRSFKFQMKNTPQNQYFPANAERMDVHCLESGCIGKYIPLGPRDFPRAGILHPSALEIALGQSLGPRGAKSPPLGNLLGLGGCIFRYIPTRGSVRTFFHHYQGTIDFVAWQQMALASERLINSTYKHWSWLNQLLCLSCGKLVGIELKNLGWENTK